MDVIALTEYEKSQLGERQALPDAYRGLSDAELDTRIAAAKDALGRRLVILGHHYQRDDVIKFADVTGDSWKLSRFAADRSEAEFIVFCGVHFMAESADVLSGDHQRVALPDLAAGCSMADMAAIDQLETCWQELADAGVTGIVPVTYINSSAAIKAFCGRHGGVVCTSSNAAAALRWAWARGERVLFLPDQHLGRNTAYRQGVPLDRMAVWDPEEFLGGLSTGQLDASRVLLWKGHCSVHTRFSVKQIDQVRAQHPGIRVIVHPECPWDVVQAADDSGSTEYIIKAIAGSPEGSVWAVGTEIHLVNRLAQAVAPARTVMTLDRFGCLCSTMFRISPNHLLWTLDGLLEGDVRNRIVVPEPQKRWARVALDRMLQIQ
ncbi:MAG: quinolinate synthase NadA [Vicinamibacterales bacterium]